MVGSSEARPIEHSVDFLRIQPRVNYPGFLLNVVIMDILPVQKAPGVGEVIRATLLYLPPYSPDLTPIEQAFSKLKAHLRKAAEHNVPCLLRRIGRLLASFSPQECRNFLHHAGYVRT